MTLKVYIHSHIIFLRIKLCHGNDKNMCFLNKMHDIL